LPRSKPPFAAITASSPPISQSGRGRSLFSRARRIAIYVARQLTGKSFRALARAFGDRSHPSIIRAFRTIERLRSADAALDRDLEALALELDSILRGRPT
jgi:chromosomal replication initiator protein